MKSPLKPIYNIKDNELINILKIERLNLLNQLLKVSLNKLSSYRDFYKHKKI
jgi:hypothetical protein